MPAIHADFWCERVRMCFSAFVKDPQTLQHLLLYGPPGSGKTTSAAWLVDQIWGAKQTLMCISMNAADERSLESIRQKVYPFLRVDWRQGDEVRKSPRFLILDECETLTEAAQLSLLTILNIDPCDICVILICNSQSRIHPKLRKRLLRIRYDPPSRIQSTNCFEEIVRGDLRFTAKQTEIESRILSYFHEHPQNLEKIINNTSVDSLNILSELLLIANSFSILDEDLLTDINTTYNFLSESTLSSVLVKEYLLKTLLHVRQKFETKYALINHSDS